MGGIMRRIIGRVIIVIPAVALQVMWYYLVLSILNTVFHGHLGDLVNAVFTVLAIIFATSLVAKRDESSYKLLWVMVIMAAPVLGAFLYLMFGNKNTGARLKKKMENSRDRLAIGKKSGAGDGSDAISDGIEAISKDNPRLAQTLGHIEESTGFPVLKNNRNTRYYPFGEYMFADMCEDLRRAQDYIYVEYFIIQSGKFWDTLTEIMAERAAAGVDVRVIYDDLGSIGTYSGADIRNLQKKGIKCIAFNPFFLIRSQLNNRDHRKIMVIDGRIAYSGGINLADEYINVVERFGRWKDIGFRITGGAALSYAYMFIEFWNAFAEDKITVNRFEGAAGEAGGENDGYVLPYYDSPMRNEHTSNELFTEILSMATGYVWFYTPYLILGDTLYDAFLRAAKRGVDVRIIMPGIPDKKMIFRLSRSYYEDLLKAGVRIFEYTPGFVHAKAFVADGVVAGIGTVNLDYRSLFLHFECNAVFYKAGIIADLKKDFEDTQGECREIGTEDLRKSLVYRFGNNVLRVVAPLL
jgi:cardiolipin synthase